MPIPTRKGTSLPTRLGARNRCSDTCRFRLAVLLRGQLQTSWNPPAIPQKTHVSIELQHRRPTGASIRFPEVISSLSDYAKRLPFAGNSGSVFPRAPDPEGAATNQPRAEREFSASVNEGEARVGVDWRSILHSKWRTTDAKWKERSGRRPAAGSSAAMGTLAVAGPPAGADSERVVAAGCRGGRRTRGRIDCPKIAAELRATRTVARLAAGVKTAGWTRGNHPRRLPVRQPFRRTRPPRLGRGIAVSADAVQRPYERSPLRPAPRWRPSAPRTPAPSAVAAPETRPAGHTTARPWMLVIVALSTTCSPWLPPDPGGMGCLTGIAPALLLRSGMNRHPGLLPLRSAERQTPAVPSQLPPRITRLEPDSGPVGSSSGEFA